MRDFVAHPYQALAIDFLASHRRCNLWAGMGMGKTSTCLTFLEADYNLLGQTHPTLVLAPLRVARDTWPNETRKWRHLQGLEIASATGPAELRAAALRRDVPVVTTNYDNLVWLRDWFREQGRAWPFRRVIADEATKLKAFRTKQGSVRAQALAEVAHRDIRDWINLTGTPAPNGLKDLWGQQWFIDAGKRLGHTYSSFEERWFAYKRVQDALTHKPGIKPVILPGADAEIHARLADCSLTLDPRDWFDIQEPICRTVEVELPKSARAKYRELEREMFLRLEDGREVEVVSAAGLTQKCLQAACGLLYLDPERYGPGVAIELHDAKLDALDSVVEEAGGAPVLTAYHWARDRERILKAFPDAIDVATPDGMARALRGEGRLWIGHPESMGHGVDGLQEHCNIVCFFGHWWDLEKRLQFIERVGPVRQLQAGKDRAVFVYDIVARDTVDEVVIARHAGKIDVMDLLLEYMKVKQ